MRARHPHRTRRVIAGLAAGPLLLCACTGDGGGSGPATSTATSTAVRRVARMQRIPCAKLAPPEAVRAVLGRPVVPAGGAAPEGTCVFAVTSTTDEFVVVAISGPVRPVDLRRQAPDGEPVDGVGDAAIWDTAIPVGGRLLTVRRGVEVGVVLQVRTDDRTALRAAAEAIARRALARVPER